MCLSGTAGSFPMRYRGLMTQTPRILIVGCGAIGGTILGELSVLLSQGRGTVVGLTTNVDVVRTVMANGLRLIGVEGSRDISGTVVREIPSDWAPFDWILLATQPPTVEAAASQAASSLADNGKMVVLQNGLCEDRIARIVGRERVIGGIVSFGASMPEPGVFERTSSGGFTLGYLADESMSSTSELGRILEVVGPVQQTDNLIGARWSKLAINCAISTLGTLGGDRLGKLMRHRFVRRLALEVMSETVAVAQGAAIKLENVAGTVDLEWLALTDGERSTKGSASLIAKHGLLMAVGTRYRNLRSSMLAAMERGRPPAVDFLNGEVVSRGEELGIPTPVNRAAQLAVHSIAAGESSFGLSTLEELLVAIP